jgi:hypothetical protein
MANASVNKIASMIESHTADLDNYKQNIEKRLLDDTRTFQNELDEVNRMVEKLKEANARRQADEQVRNIASIQSRLLKLSE